jgi:hypothetical protein
LEERSIEVSPLSGEYLGWPEVKRVFRIHRRRCERGVWSEEWAYGITSLSAKEAMAADLLSYTRRHWAIENSLHYVRDMTFHEDRCRTRCRNLAQLLAAGRNWVIMLLWRLGYREIPEGLEDFAEDRFRAIHAVRNEKIE